MHDKKIDTIIEANANFHHLAGKDLFNREDKAFLDYRRQWKENPENFTVSEFPLFIDIEVTSICNLRCPYCASTYNSKNINKGYIDEALVKKVIDEGAANGLYGVKFNYRGEPLLHPNIVDFVKYAKDKGLIDVYFNTNALTLTEETSRKLIEAGLDRISISIEGYTKDVYEANRVGSNFEKIKENILSLKRVRDEMGARHPLIRIQTVLLPDLIIDLDAYSKYWEDYADELAYLDYKVMKERQKDIAFPWACPQIWQRALVWWDGTIVPCNHDDNAKLVLGNAKEVAIRDAWNSPFLNEVREKHKAGMAHSVDGCNGCYLRDSEISKLMQED